MRIPFITLLLGLSFNWTYAENQALVIIGGEGAETVEVAAFPGSTSKCETLNPPENPHINGHKAFLLKEDDGTSKLISCGGSYIDEDGNNEKTNNCIEFDPASNSWNGFEDMDSSKSEFGATSLDDGRSIMVAGGHQHGTHVIDSAEIFMDYGDGIYFATTDEDLPEGARGLCLVSLDNENVFAIGGENKDGKLDLVQIYNRKSGLWSTSEATLSLPRSNHACIALDCNRILVVGGADESTQSEVFHVDENGWYPGPLLEGGDGTELEDVVVEKMAAVMVGNIPTFVGGSPNPKQVFQLQTDLCELAPDAYEEERIQEVYSLDSDRTFHAAVMVPMSVLPEECRVPEPPPPPPQAPEPEAEPEPEEEKIDPMDYYGGCVRSLA